MESKPKTWLPTVAGILNIVVGSLRLLGVVGLIIAMIVLSSTNYWGSHIESEIYPLTIQFVVGILIIMAVVMAVLGILSLIGGIYALQRKMWGLALAGSISSIFGPVVLGIPAVIFTAISKEEFS